MVPIVAALAIAGCVEIDGGAVELSWTVRDFRGQPVKDCRLGAESSSEDADTNDDIAAVRICWQPTELGASTDRRCDEPDRHALFACERERGVTGFDIAPGETSIWIEPVCGDGQPADSGEFEVPAPIVRQVETGAVVTLNSLLIVACPTACNRGSDACVATGGSQ